MTYFAYDMMFYFTILQAAEDYLVTMFEDGMLCAIHAKRVTLSKLI